jgi:hypothetical protein
MKEFLEKLMESVKIMFSWLTTILICCSIALNFYFAGVIWVDRDIIKNNQDYLQYKDSIQLHLMDKITDRNNIKK